MKRAILFVFFLGLSTCAFAAGTRARNFTGYSDEVRVQKITELLASYLGESLEGWAQRCTSLYNSYTHRSMTPEHVEQIVLLLERRLGAAATREIVRQKMRAFVRLRFNRLRTYIAVSDYFRGAELTNEEMRLHPEEIGRGTYFARCIAETFPPESAGLFLGSFKGPGNLYSPLEDMECINRNGGILDKRGIEKTLESYAPDFRSRARKPAEMGIWDVPFITAVGPNVPLNLPPSVSEESTQLVVIRGTIVPPVRVDSSDGESPLRQRVQTLPEGEALPNETLIALSEIARNESIDEHMRAGAKAILKQHLQRKIYQAVDSISHGGAQDCIRILIELSLPQ